MKFLESKLSDGLGKRNIAKYCRWLEVSRQGFYKYSNRPKRVWRHEDLAAEIRAIIAEDEWNDNYGKLEKRTERLVTTIRDCMADSRVKGCVNSVASMFSVFFERHNQG